jgi:hypothetical protein
VELGRGLAAERVAQVALATGAAQVVAHLGGARLELEFLVGLFGLAKQFGDRFEVILIEVVLAQLVRVTGGEDLDLDDVMFVILAELFATAVASHVEHENATLS